MSLKIEYRIPRINELVDGFSYEVYSDGFFEDGIEDIAGWYKYTIGVDCWRDNDQLKKELKKLNVRVKIDKLI